MTYEDCLDKLRAMPDVQLRDFADQVMADMEHAAISDPDSEWHGACFAALVMTSQEMGRRGIKANPAPARR